MSEEKTITQFPPELIELPSKGLAYTEDNPLSKGSVEMNLMTAKEEDILTSPNLLRSGTMIDKVLQSMLVTKFDYDTLLSGDKDMLMFAARILGFGPEYEFKVKCPHCDKSTMLSVDLTDIPYKDIDYTQLKRDNEYTFELPSKNVITFRLNTVAIEKEIEAELQGLEKMLSLGKFDKTVAKQREENEVKKDYTTRLKHIITSVNGDKTQKTIRTFVDSMLTRDTTAFKKYLAKITPGLDLNINYECSNSECRVVNDFRIPMTDQFFWPTFGA